MQKKWLWRRGEVGGKTGWSRWRGNCGQDVLFEGIINERKKEDYAMLYRTILLYKGRESGGIRFKHFSDHLNSY